MKVELVTYTPDAERTIERAMRICHGGDMAADGSTNKTFIQGVIKLGHESVIEHASVTFKISGVSRSLTHQLVRHRLASYTQESQRYVKKTDFDYICPDSIWNNSELRDKYANLMAEINKLYNSFIEAGIKREDARYMLPNACTTSIWVTMNFRELRSFFKLRCDSHAQAEIRNLSKEMLKLCYDRFPIIFEDLYKQYYVCI